MRRYKFDYGLWSERFEGVERYISLAFFYIQMS